MKKILQEPDKVLRQVAKEVPVKSINSVKIKKVIKEMSESLESQGDGVAIAAPQIGHSLRIFLVAGKIFEKDFGKSREQDFVEEDVKKEEVSREPNTIQNLVFINP